jgi:hypothetical protein
MKRQRILKELIRIRKAYGSMIFMGSSVMRCIEQAQDTEKASQIYVSGTLFRHEDRRRDNALSMMQKTLQRLKPQVRVDKLGFTDKL